MTGLRLAATDTLHFRESAPFAPTLTSPEHHSGQFPPHPTTVVGAMRAMLARAQGWHGGDWSPSIKAVLGDGPDLRALSFDGPYLLRDGEPLYAMPAHLLGAIEAGTWLPRTLLHPGGPALCDLGDKVRLPQPVTPLPHGVRWEPGTGWWLTRAGMVAALRGELPADTEVVSTKDLWRDEHRVGIQRDDTTRVVQEGMLYTSRHVRPFDNVEIGVRIDGLPEDWRVGEDQALAAPLGGEGRWAGVRPWAGDPRVPSPITETSERVAVIAVTPIDAGTGLDQPGTVIAELGATIVSACLPRAERVGGWDSTQGRGRPSPLRNILPAGSTFFCEIADAERFATAVTGGTPRVGQRQEWGFGAVALGVWPGH